MLAKISQSPVAHPREIYLIYVLAPMKSKERLLDSASRFVIIARYLEWNFCVHREAARLRRERTLQPE
jgi:hypothetical protein